MICNNLARELGRIVLIAVLLLTGCAHKPPPFQAPQALFTLTHYSGNPLSGPTTRPVANIDPSSALAVDVRVVALQQDRTGEFAPIGPQMRLIAADQAGTPVLAAGQLTRACRWATGDPVDAGESRLKSGALGPSAEMAAYKIALPNDVTSIVRAIDGPADAPGARRIDLFLSQSRPADGTVRLELALGIVDVAAKPAEPAEQGSEKPAAVAGPIHELAVLQPLEIRGPTSALILVPFAFKDGANKSVLLSIHAAMGASGDEMTKALAQCTEDLKASAAALAGRSSTPSAGIADWAGFDTAMDGIRTPASRRPSLVYLATQANAGICQDAALVANDHSLEELSNSILKQAADGKLPREAGSFGWALDAATLRFISQLQSGNKLPTELLAVLLRHTGQVGDNAGSVDELLKVSGTKKDFDVRVTAENLVYLEDNSPAARVRAFDWLSARGTAPAGYDPLAPPLQRHEALQKSLDGAAAKAAGVQP